MKLKSKLKLYEEFVNESTKETTTTTDSVAIDQVSVDAAADSAEAVRTEVIRDVDTILNNLAELSDRIGESDSIALEMDELFEELFELTNVTELNEGILDFIKSPIKFMKIKKNLKSYQKALVQKAINDVDFAKKKQAGDAGEKGKDDKRMETLKQANQAKNKALDDQLSAIGERMTELSKGDEGLGKVVSIGKTKSKLAAAKIVMKATSGEEAKQLKLEIDTLADRIADDEKSLKDYAKKEGPADQSDDDQSDDDPSDNDDSTTSQNQMDSITGKPKTKKKETPEEKEKRIEKEKKEKIAGQVEKLEGDKTKAKEKYDALGDDVNEVDKAKVKIEFVKIQLQLAELKEDDAEVIEGFKQELEALNRTAGRTPPPLPGGGGNDLSDDQKARIKTEEDQKLERETELAAEMEKPEEERNQQKIDGLEQGIRKNDEDIEAIKAEQNDSANINTDGFDNLTEASLGELMAMTEDDYAYLKGEAKKLGVKVSVSTGDDSMYADMGYDTLSFSGDKAAILKLAKISGHDSDICADGEDCGGYVIKESVVNEDSLSGIEFGNDDDIHPTEFKPLVQSLKKNKVKMEVEKEEGSHGYPEVKLTGKRKDIEKVLADVWGPDSVSDYEDAFESVEIEEGNEFGAARAEAIAKGEKTFKVGDEEYPVEDVSKEDEENAEEFVEEAKEELPKTIKLDEGLTIAQRFSRLM